MADVKIQIKVGGVEFSGEGDKEWIGKQLDKILEKVEDLQKIAPGPQPATIIPGAITCSYEARP